MLDRLPSEDEWNEWKQNPSTKLLIKWATDERMSLMEQWAGGNFSAAFDMEMAVKNAGATGACSVYSAIQELDYNQIAIGDADVGEQIRSATTG